MQIYKQHDKNSCKICMFHKNSPQKSRTVNIESAIYLYQTVFKDVIFTVIKVITNYFSNSNI